MTVILKEEFRAMARERKRKSHERNKKAQKKLTFFRNSFFHFKQNQEQKMQNFKLF